jgi:hypothetical protein
MSLDPREVLKTNTFEEQRQEINRLAQDLYDVSRGEKSLEALALDGPILDKQNKTGTAGQFLRSTGNGVLWKTLSISNVLWVTKDGSDDNDGLSEQTAKASIGSALRAANKGYLGKLQDASAQILINKKLIQEESINWLLTDYISRGVGGKEIDASNLILSNKEFIANEAVELMLSDNPNFVIPGGNQKCVSDVLKVLDAIIFNLRYGGNNKVFDAALIYVDQPELLDGERLESVQVYNYAKELAIAVMRNQPISVQGSHGINQVFDSTVIGDISGQPGIYDFENDCVDIANTIASLFGIILQGVGTESNPGDLTGISRDLPERFTFPNSPPESGRYKDSRNLIYKNIDEICDKALAEIALQYDESEWGEDWSFPVLPLPTASNRYKDASNLITANKQEIQDRALAQIAIDHPDFVFPNEPATDNHSRFLDSYRLIQQNRQEIIDTAWEATADFYPNIKETEEKCKRDLGYFIDAISLDVFLESNRYSRKFASIYFDQLGNPISNGLVGEEVESIYAFARARDLMQSAITNQLTIKDLTLTPDPVTGSNTSFESCSNVKTLIATLTSIVTSVIIDGSLNDLPSESPAYYDNDFKCYRDLGFLVDAIASDVSFESNKNIREFVLNYFNQNGTPISNGLVGEQVESITAFKKARDMMKLAITNQLYAKDLSLIADPLTSSNIDINSCSNVQTLINNLTTIATYIIEVGSLDELPEENNGTYEAEDSQRFRDSYRLIQKNREYIINEAFNELAVNYPDFVNPNPEKCRRDIGYYIDAVSLDVYLRGNKYSRKFVSFYYTGASINYLDGEVTESIFAFNAANSLMIDAIQNLLPYNESSITVDTSEDGPCANVQQLIANLGALIEDVLENGVSALSSYRENRGSFYRSESKCRRDINLIVRSIANDLYIGGNTNTFRAARKYFDIDGNLIFIQNESIQSKIAFEKAAELMKMALTNQLYEKNLTLPESFSEYNGSGEIIPYGVSGNANTCIDVQLTIDTLISILSTVIDDGNLSILDSIEENQGIWADFENICLRDIGYIVEAVASDLKNGGNINCVNAGNAYYKGSNLVFIDGEENETLATFEKAKELMFYAMRNWNVDRFGSQYKPLYSFLDLYIDNTLIIDKDEDGEFEYPLCNDVQSAIENYFNIITHIIKNGPGSVEQQLPSFKTTVFVKSGVYVEQNPIILPPNTGIVGDNLREISIVPAIPTEDLFYCNNGSYITGATFSGHLAPSVIGSFPKVKIGDTVTLPCSGIANQYEITVAYTNDLVIGMTISGEGIGTGAIITNILGDVISISVANEESFTNRQINFENFIGNTGVITRSPYIQNCTSLTTTGSGLRVDGNLAGGTASFVLDSYTQYNQGGDGIVITNGGYTQLVSIFEICCNRAVYLSGGSTCSITNSNTDFGNFGLVADGVSPLQYTAFVDGNQPRGTVFKFKGLRVEPYVGQVVTFGNDGKPYYFVQEINIVDSGDGYSPEDPPFVFIGDPTGPSGIPAQAIPVIENGRIVSVTLISSGSQFITAPTIEFVGGATPNLPAQAVAKMYPQYYSVLTASDLEEGGISTVTFDETIPFNVSDNTEIYFFQVTKIIANSHCMEYVGAGTKIEEAIPAKGGVPFQDREVVELNGGKVAFTSTDHLGNFRIGTGIQINQNTGTLSGESFERSLFVTVTPFILALS